MLDLESAIKHCEEVAKENEDSAKEYYRIANLECHPNKKDAENAYIKCTECYKEHRQLAEWLRELKAYKESDWTPCSERLPEEYEWLGTRKFGTTKSDEVYVTFENPKCERFCKHLSFQNGKLSGYDQLFIDAWHKGSKPIAWRPLPEPWGGEQDGKM